MRLQKEMSMWIRIIVFILFALLVSSLGFAYDSNLSKYAPSIDNLNVTYLHKNGFDLIYDNDAKIPVVGYYILTSEKTLGCISRSNRFRWDPEIDIKYRSYPSDYSKKGYDLGHNINAADMAWSKESSEASFFMSNMSPQLPEFNRSIFKKLENMIRDYTYESGHTVLIYVGNMWNENSEKLASGVVIPDKMFKIIIDLDEGKLSAFILPNIREFEDIEEYSVPIDEIISFTHDKYVIPDSFEYGINWVKSDRRQIKNTICAKEK